MMFAIWFQEQGFNVSGSPSAVGGRKGPCSTKKPSNEDAPGPFMMTNNGRAKCLVLDVKNANMPPVAKMFLKLW